MYVISYTHILESNFLMMNIQGDFYFSPSKTSVSHIRIKTVYIWYLIEEQMAIRKCYIFQLHTCFLKSSEILGNCRQQILQLPSKVTNNVSVLVYDFLYQKSLSWPPYIQDIQHKILLSTIFKIPIGVRIVFQSSQLQNHIHFDANAISMISLYNQLL